MKSDGVEEHELRTLLMRVAAELVAGDVKMSVTEAAVEFCADYRRGVGTMLLNNQNEVLVGRRADAKTLGRCRRAESTKTRTRGTRRSGN